MADETKAGSGEAPKPEDLSAELTKVREELEQTRGKVKKYSDEAAQARVARKAEYEEKIAALEAELKGKSTDGTPTPKPTDAEAATLRAEIAELRKKDAERDKREREREEKARDRAHRAAVTALVARHKLENPDDAIELLVRRTKLADDESTLLYTARDADTQTETDLALTDKAFPESKLLGAVFWPARGTSGGGGNSPRTVSGGGTVDEAKALEDSAYFRKHKDELIAARRNREAGRA